MIALTCNMEIGPYIFDFVNEVEITSTWEQLTDTCRITVPKALRIKNVDTGEYTDAITAGPDAIWKRGDDVKIGLGYDGDNDLRFQGYITRVVPKRPLVFECEDKMWHLKQTEVSKYSRSSVTLPELLKDILPSGVKFDAENISLGKFVIEKCTVAEVFEYLRKPPFGLSAFFQNGELYVGFPYKISSIAQIVTSELLEFEFYKNIIDDETLDYVREDDVKLKVRVVNRNDKNQITEYNYGDTFGDLRTVQTYNLTKADIDKIGNEALLKYKYEGFRGTFETFLQPMVRHGQPVKLIDPLIPDRTGVYLVRKVVTTFGMGGGRQFITLDRKVS